MKKGGLTVLLRDIPEDVRDIFIDEKARTERSKGGSCSNPRAIYQLIRRSIRANRDM